ncbi:two-component system, cell cycle response regulator [Mucilaginibacter mallensis]|uniref:Two-component system, cell cycle response regulator n=2 Tax=Mucilaginibacter mallensis TaxID=652787 RepID=A0A1H2AHQ9_MUCMA|nr:two-component system, cell cycle response regulator [Mucilaginibacter mallensis]
MVQHTRLIPTNYTFSMSRNIMIVDDHIDTLDLLKEALEQEGYAVTALSYTEDIIKSVNQHQPDLVMLDFLLAGINGGEHCHHLKVNPLTSHIPIIMLSGYPRVLESLGNYGADVFIAKPFDLTHLTTTVKHLLEDALHDHAAV